MRIGQLLLVAAVAMVGVSSVGASVGFAKTLPSPTLTVIGYGIANLPAVGASSSPQIDLNFQASAANPTTALNALAGDMAAVQKKLTAVGVTKHEISMQGPPNLNYVSTASQLSCQKIYKLKGISSNCTAPGWQASESLQVTLPTIQAAARVLTKSGIQSNPGVQNFWINQGGSSPSAPSTAALKSGYAAAFRNARMTASLLASADHLVLGHAVSVTEGALLNTPCGGMGCSPIPIQGLNPPTLGQNQELVTVTVTYQTTR